MKDLKVIGLLNNVLNGGATADGTLLAAEQSSPLHPSGEVIVTMAMNMLTSAGNDYQNEDAGQFTITALATQAPFEKDSFGSDYDAEAKFPTILTGGSASAPVTPVEGKVPAGGVTLNGGEVSAFVPEGVVLQNGITELTLTVTPLENTTSDIDVVNDEILIPMDVHIEGVADTNNVPIIVDLGEVLPQYLNMGNYRLIHVEDGVNHEMTLVSDKTNLTAHNQFTYDSDTGAVSVAMATFSEVALVADTGNAWQGGTDDTWYDADATELIITNGDQLNSFSKMVGKDNDFAGKTIKLIADINLNGNIFYPIGYYNNQDKYDRNNAVGVEDVVSNVSSFSGTFNGNGHTISNFYQNTWEMFGDYNSGYSGTPNYYKDAMGLFGYVNGGTIENLTVDHFESDGEFTPTGVIVAYAVDSNFKNIAITHCNPRVYNTGNGGIVGVGGNSNGDEGKTLSFTNITVDNTNTISALWGSWDVACGGIMGMFRGKGEVNFDNCHVAAKIDVYNDVCGNYQYYWYRYAGMMIGTNYNMTEDADGYTVPDLTMITANACTVSFDEWNDYYYCELVDNSIASYTHDYQFSRLTQVVAVDDDNMTYTTTDGTVQAIPTEGKYNYVVLNGEGYKTENATCYHFVNGTRWTHDMSEIEDFDVNGDGQINDHKEDHEHIYLPFNQLFTGYGWGVKHIPISEEEGANLNQTTDSTGKLLYPDLDIKILEREGYSEEKFKKKFTGNFLYRVGNGNSIAIGSLFETISEDISISGVWVAIEKLNENMNVSGTFTQSTTDKWEDGKIKFEGTGVVTITIQDYNYCKPTKLTVEVVDAVNATTATSATANNVVLLNDCGFSSLTVSNGYALYGNGFTMTCGSDSTASDMGYAFLILNNGTLDNVQIVCPNFDYAALYKSNLTSSDNRSETDTSGKTRYYNAKSGVMASGNSQILNSRISGARAAVNVSGGNCVIDNSRIEGGAVASVLVGAANSLILRDVILVQKPTASTYDNSKKLMGFSVLVMCSVGGEAAPITLEGTLVQNAWVDEGDKQYVPSEGQAIIDEVMKKTEYLHDINDDGTNESLNLGIAYMPADGEYTVNATTVTDNRTNKDTVPYGKAEVQYSLLTTCVYSYKNTNGTDTSTKEVGEYAPSTQSDIITVNYSDTSDGLTTGKSYGTEGWIYELNVDLDRLNSYALDFSKLIISVNGVNMTDFKVDGNAKPASPVAVVAGGTTYKLTATMNDKEYIVHYKVTGTETSKESPSLVASNYEAGLCVASSYGGTWHGAAPVLEGVQIKYWSVAEQLYKTITLSDYTPTEAGQQNGTNNYWTYTHDNDDFTLTIKNETAVHSGNSVYAMPVVCDDKLYFVASSSNGLVNTGNSARTIAITYYFKDNNNGNELKFSHTWSVEENKDEEYKYSAFCSGTLEQLKNCITPDTLITLADGSQVRVDSLTGTEELLVWNMETGSLDSAPIMFVDNDPEATYEVIKLYFSDGTEVKVISEHGFWDYDLNKYVYLDRNADQYIGHTFAKQNGDVLEKVKLVDVVLENQVTTAWSPVTAGHLCYFVNGMLSMPGGVGGLFNIFDVDAETMTYDYEAMARDIEIYGLFTYEELSQYAELSREMFDAAGGQYLKVSIGKGNLTEEELIAMIERYGKYFE